MYSFNRDTTFTIWSHFITAVLIWCGFTTELHVKYCGTNEDVALFHWGSIDVSELTTTTGGHNYDKWQTRMQSVLPSIVLIIECCFILETVSGWFARHWNDARKRISKPNINVYIFLFNKSLRHVCWQ